MDLNDNIKNLGVTLVGVKVYPGVTTEFKVNVVEE